MAIFSFSAAVNGVPGGIDPFVVVACILLQRLTISQSLVKLTPPELLVVWQDPHLVNMIFRTSINNGPAACLATVTEIDFAQPAASFAPIV